MPGARARPEADVPARHERRRRCTASTRRGSRARTCATAQIGAFDAPDLAGLDAAGRGADAARSRSRSASAPAFFTRDAPVALQRAPALRRRRPRPARMRRRGLRAALLGRADRRARALRHAALDPRAASARPNGALGFRDGTMNPRRPLDLDQHVWVTDPRPHRDARRHLPGRPRHRGRADAGTRSPATSRSGSSAATRTRARRSAARRLFEKPRPRDPAGARAHPPGLAAHQRRDDPPARLRHRHRPALPRLHEGPAPPVRPAAAAPERARRPPSPHADTRQRRVRRAETSIVVRSMIVSSLQVTHFSDPGCPWAWSASPAIAALKWRYGDQLEWRNVMIGLTENGSVYEQRGYTPAGQARGYRTFRERGMPFATEPRERVHGTWPMCRVVVATRRLAPEREYAVFRALQFAQFTTTLFLEDADAAARGDRVGPRHRRRRDHRGRQRPGDRGSCSSRTATRPARAANSPTEFQDKHANTDGRVRYTAPSIRFTNRQGVTLEAGGFQSFEAYDVLIANLDQSLTPPRARRGRRRGPAGLPGRPDDRRGRADHDPGQVRARPQQGRGRPDRRDRAKAGHAPAVRARRAVGPERARRARRRGLEKRWGAAPKAAPRRPFYGVVVDSVKVSVLLYVPVRSASLALTGCLKPTLTGSLETGPPYVFSGRRQRRVGAGRRAGGLQRLGQRERAVDQVAGSGRARVGDRQRRVTGGRDHGRRGGGEVVLAEARRERRRSSPACPASARAWPGRCRRRCRPRRTRS